ncbi:hypothetical protein BDZ94DRAFT_1320256 [Collybia nuda]|uniref:DUF6533 domain-containing protein n=1 Tax=Collybia nuda TaxID=64659 RepID=A0A9P5Y8C0_9AGAR|nr:hypothetical protein BDZ94DRAFT_1320256 [Collybia nuda]
MTSMVKTLFETSSSPVKRYHELLVNNVMCAGFAMLIYDHAITLGHEIDVIWSAPKNLTSTIFLLNRYIVPAIILVQFYEKFAPVHTLEFCKVWVFLQGYLTCILYVSLHVMMAMRVAAIHNNSSKIKRFLWVGGIFYAVSSIGLFTAGGLYIIAEQLSPLGICLAMVPTFVWSIWVPTLVVESVLFIITVYSAANRFSNCKNFGTFYHSLFRDGIVYFLVIICSTMAALIVWAEAPHTLNELARPFSLCVVTVVGSRLTLNLKLLVLEESQATSGTKASTGTTSPDFEFRTNASWNVAAPDGGEVHV